MASRPRQAGSKSLTGVPCNHILPFLCVVRLPAATAKFRPMTPVTAPATIRAPTGNSLSCKGWHQEAALRMLMNNLDPAVAERPDELIVYGGSGKAARELGVL